MTKKCLLIKVMLVLFSILLSSGAAYAYPLTVDQKIFASDANFNTSTLSATVSIAFVDSNTFSVTLTNTTPFSTIPYDAPSVVTLTGVAFQLPTGVDITGGTVMTLFYHNPSTYSEGQWWGYRNESTVGPFNNLATIPTNSVVSTLSAAVTSVFDGSVPANPSIDGPKGGIAPSAYLSYYNNWPIFNVSATFNVDVSGFNLTNQNFDTFAQGIENGNVVVSFSSPNAVPEPTTLLLLGLGLVGIAGIGRRLRK